MSSDPFFKVVCKRFRGSVRLIQNGHRSSEDAEGDGLRAEGALGWDDDDDDEPNAQSAPPTTPLDSPPPPGLALEALQIIPSKQIIFQIKYILKLGRPIGFILKFKIKNLTKLHL